jgi:hypothetical protein
MPDAWELLPEGSRTADKIETFILFCEDDVSEPYYFAGLQKEKKVKINYVPNQKSNFRNFANTIKYCIDNDLAEIVDGRAKLKEGVTEHIWCVYDRDAEDISYNNILPANQWQFTGAIQAAEQSAINVAWSNDAFELWILLHFEDVPPGQWSHRNSIYDRLTEVFQNLPNQTAEMQTVTQNEHFKYKEAMKGRQNYINFVRPYLESRRAEAIRRAKILDDYFPANVVFHDRNPCTKVYLLVQSIISFYK